LVIGDPEICQTHISGWERAGIRASGISQISKSVITCKGEANVSYIDICSRDLYRKEQLVKEAIESGSNVLTFDPLSDSIAKIRKIELESQSNKVKLITLDRTKYHPTVSKVENLIRIGNVGRPRILRIELINFENKLTRYSMLESVMDSFKITGHIFKKDPISKIRGNLIDAGNTRFHLIVATMGSRSIALIKSGISLSDSRFHIEVSGTNGMIATEEPRQLLLKTQNRILKSGQAIWTPEVLSKLFRNFAERGQHISQSTAESRLLKYTHAVLASEKIGREIQIQ
jgi:hypothetical protein